jgi:hypothetical protein
MGHTWFGNRPTSAKWNKVFEQLITGSGLAADDVATLAALTADAAATGLRKAADDTGLQFTFHILSRIGLAANAEDWRGSLALIGAQLGRSTCLFDLTAEAQSAIDEHISRHGQPTDISEIAQQAVGEAIIDAAGPGARVFEQGLDLEQAIRSASGSQGFADLKQLFFGRFVARFLNYYLSRFTAEQVGTERIPSITEMCRFNERLRLHCEESAAVVRGLCQEWYESIRGPADATPEATARLLREALARMRPGLLGEEQAGD